MSQLKRVGIWDFDAGLLPLDFANTAEWHAAPRPIEKLHSYEDLVGWSLEAKLLEHEEGRRLLLLAGEEPQEAAAALEEALRLREDVYHLFSAIAAGEPPAEKRLARFNTALTEALARARIEYTRQGYSWTWTWTGTNRDLGWMLGPILQATVDLLTSDHLERIGECEDDRGCGYLFLDTSRNHSRRWCSMDSCGNRAKALRHYTRTKSSA